VGIDQYRSAVDRVSENRATRSVVTVSIDRHLGLSGIVIDVQPTQARERSDHTQRVPGVETAGAFEVVTGSA